MSPSFSQMPNTLLMLACGPAEWRRLITAADEGGSPLWKGWLRETYFASRAWSAKREERLKLDGDKCACCGTASYWLEVYHRSEENFGDENVATDLESRCPTCEAKAQLEIRLERAVPDGEMLRSMKESLKLFTKDTEKRAVSRSAIAMLG